MGKFTVLRLAFWPLPKSVKRIARLTAGHFIFGAGDKIGDKIMGCRCAERQKAIVAGVKAIVAGDTKKAAEEIRNIGQSIRDDGRDLRNRIAASRSSLMRGR